MAVFTAVVFVLIGPALDAAGSSMWPKSRATIEVFSHGSYLEQLPVRIGEFGDLIVGNFFGLPLTVALMLTGMLAQRAGWLQQRDARAWRTASTLGLLIGLPAALLYGYWLLVGYRSVRSRGDAAGGDRTDAVEHRAVFLLRVGVLAKGAAARDRVACAGRAHAADELSAAIDRNGRAAVGLGLGAGAATQLLADGSSGNVDRGVPDHAQLAVARPDEDEAGATGSALARMDLSRLARPSATKNARSISTASPADSRAPAPDSTTALTPNVMPPARASLR